MNNMLSKLSNSTKRFEQQVAKAVDRHDMLLSEGWVSHVPVDGRLAILHSYGVTQNSRYSADEQKEVFKAEAHAVAASELADGYKDVEIRPLATGMDMDFAIQDRYVAGIVLVGHGTIAAIRMAQDHYYNWKDAERVVRQLKLGHFVQRTCGSLSVKQSLPLGTFVVADQRSIIAPPGVPIDDKYPDESLFQPIYSRETNTAADILALRDCLYDVSLQAENPSR